MSLGALGMGGMSHNFIADDCLAHTLEEGGNWLPGYNPNYSALVLRDGRVLDRVAEAKGFTRNPFDAEMLAHIERVVTGAWLPSKPENEEERAWKAVQDIARSL